MTPAPFLPTTSTFAALTGSQLVVPKGSLGWSVTVLSGAAFINGVGPIVPPYSDFSANQLLSDLVVGTTGAGHLTVVRYEAGFTAAS